MRNSMDFNKNISHFQITFSEPFENLNSRQQSQHSSPSIAYQSGIRSLSKQRKFEQSPIHNLHYKYLPSSYKLSKLQNESKQQAEMSRIRNDCKEKIGSMEQINKKIKHIINSIEKEEKRKSYYYQKYAINIPEYINHKISKFNKSEKSSHHSSVAQDFQTPSKNQIKFDRSGDNYSNLSSIESEHKSRTPLKQSVANNGNFKDIYKLSSKNSQKSLASSIYSNYFAKCQKEYNKENQEIMIKGKYLNTQIQKIRLRAENINKLKEQLNIKVQPISIPQASSTFLKEQSTPLNETLNLKLKSTDNSSIINTFTFNSKMTNLHVSCIQNTSNREGYQQKTQINVNQHGACSRIISSSASIILDDVSIPKVLRKAVEKKKKKNIIDPSQLQTQHSSLIKSKEVQSDRLFQIKRQDGSIKLMNDKCTKSIRQSMTKSLIGSEICAVIHDISTNQNITNFSEKIQFMSFLQHLQKQIKLDEHFRKAKKWFKRLKAFQKWKQLNVCLSKHEDSRIDMLSQKQLKIVFSVTSQQENPFYIPSEEDFTLEQLVSTYIDSEVYWKTSINHQYQFSKFSQTNFRQENIDLRRRGYISIEDLSRFLNCQLDSYYRNRDIYLIYQRFKKSDILHFSDIVQCIQKQ